MSFFCFYPPSGDVNLDAALKPVDETYDFAGNVIMVGAVNNNNGTTTPIFSNSEGELIVSETVSVAQNVALTSPTLDVASFPIVVLRANRKGLKITNDTDVKLLITFGITASLNTYTLPIYPGGYWNMEAPIYPGEINGICVSAPTGTVHVTELF